MLEGNSLEMVPRNSCDLPPSFGYQIEHSHRVYEKDPKLYRPDPRQFLLLEGNRANQLAR